MIKFGTILGAVAKPVFVQPTDTVQLYTLNDQPIGNPVVADTVIDWKQAKFALPSDHSFYQEAGMAEALSEFTNNGTTPGVIALEMGSVEDFCSGFNQIMDTDLPEEIQLQILDQMFGMLCEQLGVVEDSSAAEELQDKIQQMLHDQHCEDCKGSTTQNNNNQSGLITNIEELGSKYPTLTSLEDYIVVNFPGIKHSLVKTRIRLFQACIAGTISSTLVNIIVPEANADNNVELCKQKAIDYINGKYDNTLEFTSFQVMIEGVEDYQKEVNKYSKEYGFKITNYIN